MDQTQERLDALEQHVRRLERQLAAERARSHRGASTEAAAATAATSPASSDPAELTRRSRRALLAVGAATAGAIAAAPLSSRPVAADSGDPLVIGGSNTATTSFGTVLYQADNNQTPSVSILAATDVIAGQTDNLGFGPAGAPAALAGLAYGNKVLNGVKAGAAARIDNSVNYGHALALSATDSARSHIQFRSTMTDPRDDEYAHGSGEMRFDANGVLWFCVAAGTPGTWRALTTPTSSGALHVIDPIRVYDSRFNEGPLGDGFNRTIDVSDAIDVTTGSVTMADAVPAGATAVAYNLTVTNTAGGGFLAVSPGDADELTASTINWSNTGQQLANASFSTLDTDRQLRVFAGGGSTDFIVDITAYAL